jgi:hypothetical protein
MQQGFGENPVPVIVTSPKKETPHQVVSGRSFTSPLHPNWSPTPELQKLWREMSRPDENGNLVLVLY